HTGLIHFFFNDTATTEIYTLSLHDALPICSISERPTVAKPRTTTTWNARIDRKSTRLNSSHTVISYAVFCLKTHTEAVALQSVAWNRIRARAVGRAAAP